MTLRDAHGSLTLDPVRRRPEGWALIRLEVERDGRSWSTLDECLMRYEVRELARWLRSVARGREPKPLEFIEPNLTFECLAGGSEPRLRVWFELEARPAWASPSPAVPMRDLALELAVGPEELEAAAATLRAAVDALEAA